MARQQQQAFGGPKLPKELLDKIGGPVNKSNRHAPSRKQQRQNQRQQKKVLRTQPRQKLPQRPARAQADTFDDDDEDDEDDEALSQPPPPAIKSKVNAEEKATKSILKKSGRREPESEREDDDDVSADREHVPDSMRMSRTVRERLAQDDAEIAALEKRLGIKKKKRSAAGDGDDGLDDIFDGLDEALGYEKPAKRKLTEDEEWLQQKRRRVGKDLAVEEDSDDENEDEEDGESDDEDGELEGDSELEAALNGDSASEDEDDGEDDGLEEEDTAEEGSGDDSAMEHDILEEYGAVSDDDDFEDFDEDEVESTPQPRVRENPYRPGVTGPQEPAAKYIPPSLRKANGSEDEDMKRLHRQTQGQINRLSEANLISILQAVEQLYANNARQHVTTTLIDILVTSISDKTTLMDTFLILHAGFIAAIYKVIGTDFGAQVVERVVSDMDRCLHDIASGKQASNLLSLLAELYNFQVIGPAIIFDYIRTFIDDLSEDSTELLLRVIRMSGSSLRQDDPSALKEIVLQIQKTVSNVGETNLSVRQKFMIETINALKNNRMKTGLAASAVATEHTTRMKKTLGSLNNRNLRAHEPLRITLDDIRNTEKKGKWWLVGASYHDPSKMVGNEPSTTKSATSSVATQVTTDDGEVDLLQLAREQRMNTDVRRAIFITIMSATDCKDANIRLLKLNLKKAQTLEIPRVLIHCSGAEQNYNAYYTVIAKTLCADKKIRKSFQFALWDLFKRMGERNEADDNADDDDEESLDLRKLLHLAKMFASMISEGALSITVLKNLNFAYLQPKTKTFLEILLTTVFVTCSGGPGKRHQSLDEVMSNAHDVPEMIRGLKYFIEAVVAKSTLVEEKTKRKALSTGCKIALRVLQEEQTRSLSDSESD